jgi:hypothetical protein
VIGADPNVLFKIGIGEVPLLHQITFSIWPDGASMARFARGDGPHGRAIKAVREEGWFTDELYARFRVLGVEGRWNGAELLSRQPRQPAAPEAIAATRAEAEPPTEPGPSGLSRILPPAGQGHPPFPAA